MPEWKDFRHMDCCPCHTVRKLAYTIDEAAWRTGVSPDLIRGQIAYGYLAPRYVNSKPIIPHDELIAWLNSLPSESK